MASRTRSRRSSAGGAAGLPGGQSKENLWVDVRGAAAAFAGRSSLGQDQVDCSSDVRMLRQLACTWRGRGRAEEGNSWSVPLSWLKLTSRIVMLLDDTNSDGRPLESEL
ncbi:hypothetical protein ZWY2020_027181 [Hordeum vulgare]|nr:hypothetical protein ZWY2020_027181 [Hordeum vulgare]